MLSHSSGTVLNVLRDLCKAHAWFDRPLRVLANSAMDLSTLAIVSEEVIILHAIQVTLFFAGSAILVVILVLHLFTNRIVVVWEELRNGDSRRVRLKLCTSLLLLWLPLLFLLRGTGYCIPSGGIILLVIV